MMQGHFRFHYYTGSCEEMKKELLKQFKSKVQQHAWDVCGSTTCRISDVKVHCGVDQRRQKRQIHGLLGGSGGSGSRMGSHNLRHRPTPKPRPGIVHDLALGTTSTRSLQILSRETFSSFDSRNVIQSLSNADSLTPSITSRLTDMTVSSIFPLPSINKVMGHDVSTSTVHFVNSVPRSTSSVSVIASVVTNDLKQFADSIPSIDDLRLSSILSNAIMVSESDDSVSLELGTPIGQLLNGKPSSDFVLALDLLPTTSARQYSDLPPNTRSKHLLVVLSSFHASSRSFGEKNSRENSFSSIEGTPAITMVESSLVKEPVTMRNIAMETISIERDGVSSDWEISSVEEHVNRKVTQVLVAETLSSSSVLFASFHQHTLSEQSSQLGTFQQLSGSSISLPLFESTPVADFRWTFTEVVTEIPTATVTRDTVTMDTVTRDVTQLTNSVSMLHSLSTEIGQSPHSVLQSQEAVSSSFTRSSLLAPTMVSRQEPTTETSLEHLSLHGRQSYGGGMLGQPAVHCVYSYIPVLFLH